ncbi:MAG TPA: DUF4965 domain-containing protein [Isosphaeraceae bacterium]|jgi:hypothetical protein|nr:DUF4965 domain-containing protein [Isosphaeraceae bacterium]
MIRLALLRLATLTVVLASLSGPAFLPPAQADEPFRPPAVPLVTHDPYFSVWSMADRPTDDWSRHWTGTVQAMWSLARIDGKPFRLLGPAPQDAPAMTMAGLEVTPTRTIYRLESGGVRITLTFTSPLLPHDLDLLARHVTYLNWDVQATDGQQHSVAIYFDATAELAVNKADQPVAWERSRAGGLEILRVGTASQPVLGKTGDNLRIDWGFFYLATPRNDGTSTVLAHAEDTRSAFAASGKLPDADDNQMPRPASENWPVLAFAFDLGKVGSEIASRHVLLAYDELFSVEYLGKRLRPYWRRHGMELADLLEAAERDRKALTKRCEQFDTELMADLELAGGPHYARLCALAYRQCLAAHALVEGPDGQPFLFSKENFSNGCIATVDVTYPSSPFFLLFNPALLRAQLVPVLDYARSDRWKFPFAPHDLGTYPKANGQVYGGGEKTMDAQMPVEECGNMLIMVAALAKAEGNADFAVLYWPLLTRWADYLKEKGLDPENQLCTDDFAGHLAHNTNLSLKAIVALGGYAMLGDMAGKRQEAAAYRKAAEEMARRWVTMADDGDHYRLAFDKPGTWSQKYNLVWDKILSLGLFPPGVAEKELNFYLTHQQPFGLPLDNRSLYTKLDWIVWTATLASSRKTFDAIIEPVYQFAQRSPSRVPLTDWYWTDSGKQRGFQARSVVGGIFIKLLDDPVTWTKWRQRAAAKAQPPRP